MVKGGEFMRKRFMAILTALALLALVVLPAAAGATVISPTEAASFAIAE